MEGTTDADYRHAKTYGKNLKEKIQANTMMFMFKVIHYYLQMCFRNKCIEIQELDPTHFRSAPGLAGQASLKKTEVELELLTDVDMLLTVEKGIKGGMCHAIHRYAKVNNKYMKKYNKDKESSYLMYLHANNLYGWAMSQKITS